MAKCPLLPSRNRLPVAAVPGDIPVEPKPVPIRKLQARDKLVLSSLDNKNDTFITRHYLPFQLSNPPSLNPHADINMVKNSSLRNSTSSLSLRPKPTIEVPTDPTATPSISSMPPQMSGNKLVPIYTKSPLPVDATHRRGVQPDRGYFLVPPPPPFNPDVFKFPDVITPEKPKLPDVLDDGWFEQKLQKLMDMKLELARTRLESQGQNMQDPSLALVGAAVEAQGEEEEAEARPECLVKPVEEYTKPFCEFLTENPTVFHAVDYFKRKLKENGFIEVRCSLNFPDEPFIIVFHLYNPVISYLNDPCGLPNSILAANTLSKGTVAV